MVSHPIEWHRPDEHFESECELRRAGKPHRNDQIARTRSDSRLCLAGIGQRKASNQTGRCEPARLAA
jgi:hypothetical protein